MGAMFPQPAPMAPSPLDIMSASFTYQPVPPDSMSNPFIPAPVVSHGEATALDAFVQRSHLQKIVY